MVVGAVISGIAASVIGLGIQLIAIKKTLQKIAFGDMSKGESELSLLDNLKSVFTSKKPIEGVNIGKAETEKLTGQTSPNSTVTLEAQKKTKQAELPIFDIKLAMYAATSVLQLGDYKKKTDKWEGCN